MRLFFTLALLIWSATAFAQTPEDERDFLTGLIEDAISNEDLTVRLINFQGALSSEATADAITLADPDGVWLRLDDLTITWDRSALLSGRVEIEKLSADRIELIRLPQTPDRMDLPSAEATPFSLPELPVSVDINNVSAAEIVLTEALLGEPVTAQFEGALTLKDGAGDAQVLLVRTDTKTGRFDVDAAYENDTRQLSLSLLAEEGENGIAARLLGIPDRPALRLDVQGDAPLDDFTGEIALATDGIDRVTGTVQLSRPSGGVDQAFNIDLNGDLRPLMAAQYHRFFGARTILRADGTAFGVGGVRLSTLTLAADQLVLRGSGEVDARGWPVTLDLRGRLGSGRGERVRLPISGIPTEVSGMSLNVAYDASTDDTWTAAFDITSLVREGLAIDALALSGNGTLVPGAGASDGVFSADLSYAARGLAFDDEALNQAIGRDITGQVELNRTEGDPLTITALTLSGAGIDARGDAVIEGPSGRFETQANLDIEATDFARFAALSGLDLSGAGSIGLSATALPFDGSFNLALTAQTTDLGFGIEQVDPLLTGVTQLALLAERNTTGTRLRRVRLIGDALSAQAQADITSAGVSADVTAEITELSRVLPELSGAATLTVDVTSDAQGVIMLDTQLATPNATATLQTKATPTTGGYALTPDLTLSVDDLSAYAPLTGVRLGGAVTAELDGTYSTATGALDAAVSAQTRALRVGPAASDPIFGGTGQINANLSLSEARRLRLDALNVDFPNFTANGAIASSGNDTTATLSARLRDISLLVSDFSGPLSADVTARQDAAGWQIRGTADGPAGTNAQTSGRVSNGGIFDLGLTGSAPLALANIYIAPRQIKGLARFDLRLNGPAALTSLRGPVQISDARLSAPNLRQAVEDINGTLLLAGGTLRLDLRGASAAGGNITIGGPVDLTPPFQAGLNVALSDVVLRDPTLYRTTAQGRISIAGPLAGGAAISGVIDIGATEVQVPSTGVSALGSLPEVTHLGPRLDVQRTLERAGVSQTPQTQRAEAAGPAYPLDLSIRAPSRIFVRGRGLDAELGGALRLTGTTKNVIPIGRFDLIRGRLSILGQRFDLTEGYAQLQGDFTPYLRLVATTEARTGTMVSIIVEGEANDINVRFESSPELPQDEVLAQLLFGRDLSSISPLQAVQLASAVATLAGSGNGGVINSLREGLDLDDLDLVTDEDGNAAVRAGKYISDNVYTDVTVGANGTSEINLNIDINRNFTARGSVASDGETSLGIFFERDY